MRRIQPLERSHCTLAVLKGQCSWGTQTFSRLREALGHFPLIFMIKCPISIIYPCLSLLFLLILELVPSIRHHPAYANDAKAQKQTGLAWKRNVLLGAQLSVADWWMMKLNCACHCSSWCCFKCATTLICSFHLKESNSQESLFYFCFIYYNTSFSQPVLCLQGV